MGETVSVQVGPDGAGRPELDAIVRALRLLAACGREARRREQAGQQQAESEGGVRSGD
jgi:hypothetical protein